MMSNTVNIMDYEDGDIENIKKIPSIEKILEIRDNFLEKIATEAKALGYIDFCLLCSILAENSEYDTAGLLDKLGINTRWIVKSKGLCPDDTTFMKRRGEWYFLLLRLTTGVNSRWEYDGYAPQSIGAPSHMPTYVISKITGKIELVSDTDRRDGRLNAHGYRENIPIGDKQDQNHIVKIKLSDLEDWFKSYLKQPLPKRLFPDEAVLKKLMQVRKDKGKRQGNSPDIAITKDSDLFWNGIIVTFINDSEVLFQYKDMSVTRSYQMAGFMDNRNSKPINAWQVLLEASKRNGNIPLKLSTRGRVEKIAQVIRKQFRELFPGVQGDPLPLNKRHKERYYKTAFHLKNTLE